MDKPLPHHLSHLRRIARHVADKVDEVEFLRDTERRELEETARELREYADFLQAVGSGADPRAAGEELRRKQWGL